jgi:hypothetical protein
MPCVDPNLVSLLKDEYLSLQNTYEDFDRRALTIKGWSVTVSLAALGLGVQYKAPFLWFLACAATLLFWAIEAKWKTFQYAYSGRIKLIEAYFKCPSNPPEIVPFQIYASWFESYKKQSILRCATMPMVFLPHFVIIVLGIAMLIVFYSTGGAPWLQTYQTH